MNEALSLSNTALNDYYSYIYSFYSLKASSIDLRSTIIDTFRTLLNTSTTCYTKNKSTDKHDNNDNNNTTNTTDTTKKPLDRTRLLTIWYNSGLLSKFIESLQASLEYLSSTKLFLKTQVFNNQLDLTGTAASTNQQQPSDNDDDEYWNDDDYYSYSNTEQSSQSKSSPRTEKEHIQLHYDLTKQWVIILTDILSTPLNTTTQSVKTDDIIHKVYMLLIKQEQLCVILIPLLDTFKHSNDSIIPLITQLLWSLVSYRLSHPMKLTLDTSNAASYTDDECDSDGRDMGSSIGSDTETALVVVTEALYYKLQHGSSLKDKECRNDLLIVLCQLIQLLPTTTTTTTTNIPRETVDFLIIYTCIAETGSDNKLPVQGFHTVLGHFATSLEVDVQFKQLCWQALSDLMTYLSALTNDNGSEMLNYILQDSPVMESLMMYMEQNPIISLVTTQNTHTNLLDGTNSSHTLPHYLSSPIKLGNTWSHSPTTTKTPYTTTMKNTTSNITNMNTTQNYQIDTPVRTYFQKLNCNQLIQFQLQLLKLLSTHIHTKSIHIIDPFLACNGIQKTLGVIHHYNLLATSSSGTGTGNKMLGEAKGVVYYGMMVVYSVLSVSSLARNILCEYDGITIMLSMLLDHHEDSNITTVLLLCISHMCADDSCYKLCQARFQDDQGGLYILIQTLESYSANRRSLVGNYAGITLASTDGQDQQIDHIQRWKDQNSDPFEGDVPIVVVATLACIHKILLNNAETQNLWAKCGGLDVLLSMLEISPYTLRIQVLRILTDVLSNPLLHTIYIHWKSSLTFRDTTTLLVHCWLDEEVRLGLSRDDNGAVRDMLHPLSANHKLYTESNPRDELILRTPTSPHGHTRLEDVRTPAHHGADDDGDDWANEGRGRDQDEAYDEGDMSLTRQIQRQLAFDSESNPGDRLGNVRSGDESDSDSDDDGAYAADNDRFQARQPSVVVTKLAEAILKSRQHASGMAPHTDREQALRSFDARGLIANIFYLTDIYHCKPSTSTVHGGRDHHLLHVVSKGELYNHVDSIYAHDWIGPSLRPSIDSTTTDATGTDTAATTTAIPTSPSLVDKVKHSKQYYEDQKVVAMTKRYALLRQGEAWQHIHETLVRLNIQPIEADQLIITYNIDLMLQACIITQKEQYYYTDKIEELYNNINNIYINTILIQQNNEIKVKWMKKNGPKLRRARMTKKSINHTILREPFSDSSKINLTSNLDIDSSDEDE